MRSRRSSKMVDLHKFVLFYCAVFLCSVQGHVNSMDTIHSALKSLQSSWREEFESLLNISDADFIEYCGRIDYSPGCKEKEAWGEGRYLLAISENHSLRFTPLVSVVIKFSSPFKLNGTP